MRFITHFNGLSLCAENQAEVLQLEWVKEKLVKEGFEPINFNDMYDNEGICLKLERKKV